MPAEDEKNRIAAFESYLKDLGIGKFNLTIGGAGETSKYHYHGNRGGVRTDVTFDPGTILDGTYNIFLSDNVNQSGWFGVITPGKGGEYSLMERGEKPEKPGPPKNAAPAQPAPPARSPVQAPQPQQVIVPSPQLPAPQRSGKYHMHLVRNLENSQDKLETGLIVLTDGQDKVAGEYQYKSGPWGKGHAPHVPRYLLAKEIQPFTTEGSNPHTQAGLRISNKSFQGLGRGGILIHKDGGAPGTLGCFGLQGCDWEEFEKTWKAIPAADKPDEMRPLNKTEYARMKAQSAIQSAAQGQPPVQTSYLNELPFEPGFGAGPLPPSPKPAGKRGLST